MKFKLLSLLLLFSTCSLQANEIEIIELHTNKSLDQLVLDSENLKEVNNKNKLSIDIQDQEENNTEVNNQNDEENLTNVNNDANQLENNEDSNTINSDIVSISETKTIFEIDEKILFPDIFSKFGGQFFVFRHFFEIDNRNWQHLLRNDFVKNQKE